ncbi:hypothetical protein QTN25_007278 [Entamoeba marina]
MSNEIQENNIHAEISDESVEEMMEHVEEDKPVHVDVTYSGKIDPIVEKYINSLIHTKAMIRSDIEARMVTILLSSKACQKQSEAVMIAQQKLKERSLDQDVVTNVKRLGKVYNVEAIKSELYGGSMFKKTLVQDAAVEQFDAKQNKKKKKT